MAAFLMKQRRPFQAMYGQLTIIISIICATLYGFSALPPVMVGPISLLTAVKGVSIFLVVLFMIPHMARFDVAFIALGMIASGVGDILIQDEIIFASGLSGVDAAIYAFGTAQILYSIVFLANISDADQLTSIRFSIGGGIWGILVLLAFYTYPNRDLIPLNVIVYTGLITLMATTALVSRYPLYMVGIGGVLFLTADALLGANLVFQLNHSATPIIWPCYYIGQLLIAIGVVLSPRVPKSNGRYNFS